MKKFSYITRLQYKVMAQALEFGEAEEDGEGYTRKEVAKDIQSLVEACFMFGLNPLPRLRQLFPRFAWQHHDISGLNDDECDRARRRIISNSDIFWEVEHTLSYTFVTAAVLGEKHGVPMALYGSSTFAKLQKDESRPTGLEWLKSMGAQDIGS